MWSHTSKLLGVSLIYSLLKSSLYIAVYSDTTDVLTATVRKGQVAENFQAESSHHYNVKSN